MSEKRWISRSLVNLLIKMRNYDSAADVVSGSEDVFAMQSRLIGNMIARGHKLPGGILCPEIKRVLDEAQEEIQDHDQWQDEVLKTLPPEDDHNGLTGPLRQAFTKSASARIELLREVMQLRR